MKKLEKKVTLVGCKFDLSTVRDFAKWKMTNGRVADGKNTSTPQLRKQRTKNLKNKV
jgi:hypothetical protein